MPQILWVEWAPVLYILVYNNVRLYWPKFTIVEWSLTVWKFMKVNGSVAILLKTFQQLNFIPQIVKLVSVNFSYLSCGSWESAALRLPNHGSSSSCWPTAGAAGTATSAPQIPGGRKSLLVHHIYLSWLCILYIFPRDMHTNYSYLRNIFLTNRISLAYRFFFFF